MDNGLPAEVKSIIENRLASSYASIEMPADDNGVQILGMSQREYNTVCGLTVHGGVYSSSDKLKRLGWSSLLIGGVYIVVDQFAPPDPSDTGLPQGWSRSRGKRGTDIVPRLSASTEFYDNLTALSKHLGAIYSVPAATSFNALMQYLGYELTCPASHSFTVTAESPFVRLFDKLFAKCSCGWTTCTCNERLVQT